MKTLATLLLLTLAFCPPAWGKHFRWTTQVDAMSMDPHTTSEQLNRNLNFLAYDSLVERGKDMELVPWLATRWENPSPNRWIFHLRRGVKFHDGTPLTADDVVFSFLRATHSLATIKVAARQAGTPRALDDHTVEFTTPVPNPLMPELAGIPVMSRAWCEKHGSTRPQTGLREEIHATRHANGSGPYILVSREPGVRTVYRKNPDWWGIAEGLYDGNVETVEHLPLATPHTRLAALKSGSVDLVRDLGVQDVPNLKSDPAIRLWDGVERRVVYLGFDLERDELLFSDVKGRNPFKDRRVRRALYQAIDVEALRTQVMRGLARPTAVALQDPAGAGIDATLDVRHRFDPGEARRLLTQAGFPQGFSFTMHCTNDRAVNDEKLCQAIAAMWARIGVKVRLDMMAQVMFFPIASERKVSAYIMSFGSGSSEPIHMWKPVMRSPGGDGAGSMNYGNARNAELDALIDRIEVEPEAADRRALTRKAVRIMQEEIPVIPLHLQVIPWATRANISVVHRGDNFVVPMWVKVN